MLIDKTKTGKNQLDTAAMRAAVEESDREKSEAFREWQRSIREDAEEQRNYIPNLLSKGLRAKIEREKEEAMAEARAKGAMLEKEVAEQYSEDDIRRSMRNLLYGDTGESPEEKRDREERERKVAELNKQYGEGQLREAQRALLHGFLGGSSSD